MKNFDEFYESLWKNIKDKRDRIARGSGEKMRKPGEKGAPTKDQMDKAKGEGVNLDRENERIAREKAADKKKFMDRRQRAKQQDSQITQTQQNNSYMENAPSLPIILPVAETQLPPLTDEVTTVLNQDWSALQPDGIPLLEIAPLEDAPLPPLVS